MGLFSRPVSKVNSISNGAITANGVQIGYELKRSKRRNVAIHILANGKVVARAPHKTNVARVEKFILANAHWIAEKQKAILLRPQKKPLAEYKNGGFVKYLGQDIPIKIIQDIKANAVLIDDTLFIHTPFPNNSAKVQKLAIAWVKAEAERILKMRLELCKQLAQQINIKFNGGLKFRNMKSRWGSCTSKGSIALNRYLLHTPLVCIDYVILHELCHLREHNHSPKFYALLDTIMPGHKKIAKQLSNYDIGSV